MHGLVFELKERMNSRQDQPVMQLLIICYIFFNVHKHFQLRKYLQTKKKHGKKSHFCENKVDQTTEAPIK
jgi:hypothetical protein